MGRVYDFFLTGKGAETAVTLATTLGTGTVTVNVKDCPLKYVCKYKLSPCLTHQIHLDLPESRRFSSSCR